MKKFIYLLMTLVPLLFFSCAGGTSSADGDVGYLSFGSSRAVTASTMLSNSGGAAALTDWKLEGTRNGKTTSFGTWAAYADISGASVAVPAGRWTFVLSGKGSQTGATRSLLFTSEQKVVITAGEDTSVTFTMAYNGVPVSEAQTGDVILTQGTNEIAVATSAFAYFTDFAVEGVAMRASDGHVYGIKNDTMLGSYSVVYNNYPGWGLPSKELMSEIYSYYISGALSSLVTSLSQLDTYWTSSGSSSHWYCVFSNGSFAMGTDSQPRKAIFVKPYN